MTKKISGPLNAVRETQELLEKSSRDLKTFLSQVTGTAEAPSALKELLASQETACADLISKANLKLVNLDLSGVRSNISDLFAVNKAILNLAVSTSMFGEACKPHFLEQKNLYSLKSIVTPLNVSDLLGMNEVTDILSKSLENQIRIQNLEDHTFGLLIDAPTVFSNEIGTTLGKFTRSYLDMIEAVPNFKELQQPFLTRDAVNEYALELDVLESITVNTYHPLERKELPSIDNEIVLFDKRLIKLINGARESLKSTNPDKARHVTTSLRELFNYTLHTLAPDAKFIEWSNDKNHFHNGRPTRIARLNYICRNFSSGVLSQFVEDDVKAVITLVDALNGGTHGIESKLNENQLQAIILRMESLVSYLIKIAKKNS